MNDNSDAGLPPNGDSSSGRKQAGFSVKELFAVLIMTTMLVALLIAFMLPAQRVARPAARSSQCKNNLKQIALALHNYADIWDALPPAYTVDADGNPLHSWRTLILPYLDQGRLYETIDLSKAWNDPANAAAYEAAVSVYHCPSSDCPNDHTTYMAVVASGSCFRPDEPRPFPEIIDEFGESLMVIEANSEQAVHWMSPRDVDAEQVISFGPKAKLPHSGGLHAAFVNGSVRSLSADTPAAERRKWISISRDNN